MHMCMYVNVCTCAFMYICTCVCVDVCVCVLGKDGSEWMDQEDQNLM